MTSMVKYIKTQVPHFESQTHRQILPISFPKYEVTPHLLKLQFKNPDFVETFLLQLLIMIDCLLHPIKDQKRTIKISDTEKPQLEKLKYSIGPVLEQIDRVKLINTKMTFQTSKAFQQVIKREQIWTESKNNINTQAQFSLADFKRPARKREVKAIAKDPLVTKLNVLNSFPNAKSLFGMLEKDTKTSELIARGDFDKVKKCSMHTLNDFIDPVLQDMDPDNDVDEEYKRKRNQIFCWRFIRTVSFIDQDSF